MSHPLSSFAPLSKRSSDDGRTPEKAQAKSLRKGSQAAVAACGTRPLRLLAAFRYPARSVVELAGVSLRMIWISSGRDRWS